MIESNNTSNETVSTEQTSTDSYRNSRGNRRGWNLQTRTKEQMAEHGRKGAQACTANGTRFKVWEHYRGRYVFTSEAAKLAGEKGNASQKMKRQQTQAA